eukprot:484197-Pelagomonas_calceolata.AAC.7
MGREMLKEGSAKASSRRLVVASRLSVDSTHKGDGDWGLKMKFKKKAGGGQQAQHGLQAS